MKSATRSAALVAVSVAALAAVVVIGLLLVPRALGFPVLIHRVSDARGQVSIELPSGWHFEAPRDGGSMSTHGGSSGEDEPYRVADIGAFAWSAGPVQRFDVEVLPHSNTSASAAQADLARETCQVLIDCAPESPVEGLTVDGYPALEQLLSVDGPTIYVSTLVTPNVVIRYIGFSESSDDAVLHRTAWQSLGIS